MAIVSKSSAATVLVVILVVCGGYYVYEQTGHDKAQAARDRGQYLPSQ